MFCRKCGKEIPDGSRYCQHCATTQNPHDISWASDSPAEENSPTPKKSKGKKVGIIILIAVIVLFMVAIIGSNENETTAPDNNTTTTEAVKATSQNKKNNVGDFNVRLKNAVITADGDGENVLLVTYTFTNNSDENAAFYTNVIDTAFQNGIELEKPIFNDIKGYDHNLKGREIQPGKTFDVQEAFFLDDTSTDVEIQLSRWIASAPSGTITIKLK